MCAALRKLAPSPGIEGEGGNGGALTGQRGDEDRREEAESSEREEEPGSAAEEGNVAVQSAGSGGHRKVW